MVRVVTEWRCNRSGWGMVEEEEEATGVILKSRGGGRGGGGESLRWRGDPGVKWRTGGGRIGGRGGES